MACNLVWPPDPSTNLVDGPPVLAVVYVVRGDVDVLELALCVPLSPTVLLPPAVVAGVLSTISAAVISMVGTPMSTSSAFPPPSVAAGVCVVRTLSCTVCTLSVTNSPSAGNVAPAGGKVVRPAKQWRFGYILIINRNKN
jgi:hypothetical protein